MAEEHTTSGYVRYLTLARVGALCDGIFTISMTLLVLQLKIPSFGSVHSEADLLNYLVMQYPTGISYIVSFIMLGAYWFTHHLQFNYMKHQIDLTVFWLNMLFFLLVAIIPFTTGMLGEFHDYSSVQLIYAANLVCLSLTLRAHLEYAYRSGAIKPDQMSSAQMRRFGRRLLIIPSLCIVTMLCALVSTKVSFFLFVGLPIVFVAFNRNNVVPELTKCVVKELQES